MKKPVTPEQKPPIPDTWYLVKIPYSDPGWVVALYNPHHDCWFDSDGRTMSAIEKYIPEPLNEIE